MCVCMCVVTYCLLPTAIDSGDNGIWLIAMLVTAGVGVGVGVVILMAIVIFMCVLRR